MNYIEKTGNGLRGINSIAKELRIIATQVAFTHGKTELVERLDAISENLHHYVDFVQKAIDDDLQEQRSQAQATVGGILHDLLQK
jgi:bifunctional pyridoxal-dependent enzyme with beta-cystathionase and maltose regulon repressor activities